MADIVNRSYEATINLVYDLHHIVRSVLHQIGEEHRIVGYDKGSSTSHDHHLDLRCHPLQFVCNLFEVEGEGELIGEVVVEMVGKVVVEMVREVVVHLSRHCLLPYPPYLPITQYFHTSPYLPITQYFYTPTDLHITFHTPTYLHIFTISGVVRAIFHVTPQIIP